MSDFKVILPKTERSSISGSRERTPEEHRQWMLMAGSLFLLLLALGIILWHDRDFWFPDTEEAETDMPVESSPPPTAAHPSVASPKIKIATVRATKGKHPVVASAPAAAPQTAPPGTTPPGTTTTRTVLPPLEVEVVAGDTHRTIRPGSSSVHVDLRPGTLPRPATDAVLSRDTENAAHVTNDAAERVAMSADTSEIVTRTVRPDYPLLARQMKVEGSVILQALIGKDGIIQNLRVISGPRILASAAEDAVRQWHFKPHFQGNEAVETQAKITVNFTISTN